MDIERLTIHCDVAGKVCYSHKQAITTMNRIRKQRHLKREKPVRVYRCDYCDYWHLTSQADKENE